jgi:hypothetical protein
VRQRPLLNVSKAGGDAVGKRNGGAVIEVRQSD